MRCSYPTRSWLALVLAGLAASAVQAQAPKDTLRLTVQAAVARALTSSDEIRISQAQVSLADAQVVAARATGLPQARLTSTYSHAYQNARAGRRLCLQSAEHVQHVDQFFADGFSGGSNHRRQAGGGRHARCLAVR